VEVGEKKRERGRRKGKGGKGERGTGSDKLHEAISNGLSANRSSRF